MTDEPTVEYYGDITYWNSFTTVQRYLNRLATGEADTFWYDHLLRQRGRFDRALILNCGNGWVERELVRVGLVGEVVGIDISTPLITEAQRLAAEAGAPITYQRVDINSDALPPGPFDLVVNHAAAHHITRIDRVFRDICRLLPEDGVFVSWDYIGPHRNQYTSQQWDAAYTANRELPARFQQQLNYPHIPTMIVSDPTEAVHSELIMPTMRRYFHIDSHQNLGGAIGYLVMTHNPPLYEAPLADVEQIVESLIEQDEAFVAQYPDQTLFAYIVARPNHAALAEIASLERWSAEEDARESAAANAGGVYYPPTMVAAIEYAERPGPLPIHEYSARRLLLHLASRVPFVGQLGRRVRNLVRRLR